MLSFVIRNKATGRYLGKKHVEGMNFDRRHTLDLQDAQVFTPQSFAALVEEAAGTGGGYGSYLFQTGRYEAVPVTTAKKEVIQKAKLVSREDRF